MQAWLDQLLLLFALPQFGLSTVFVVSFLSATLLPLGSEAVVFGLVKLNPELFWPTIAVATVGNTLGGAVSWAMGLASHKMVDRVRHSTTHVKALEWLERIGPKACLLAWLPGVGDRGRVREALEEPVQFDVARPKSATVIRGEEDPNLHRASTS